MIISSLVILLLLPLATINISNISTDKQDYLKILLKQYQNIQRLITDIETIDDNLNINIALVANSSTQARLRVGALQDEQKIILQMFQNIFLPYASKTWNCPTIPTKNYTTMMTTINKMSLQAYSSLNTVNNEPYCYRNQQMKQRYQFLLTITKGLKKQIVSKCTSSQNLKLSIPFLDTQNARHYPNLITQAPWIYGRINANQFQDKVKQFSSIYGATPCPLSLPFLSKDNICFKCTNDGQVYDISLKSCKKCGSKCIINGGTFNSNIEAGNYKGVRPNKLIMIPSCSKNEPFFDKRHCISCNLPLYFNFATNKCESCPNDEGFDQASKQCKSNIFFISFDGKGKNFIGNPPSPPPHSTLKKCTQKAPYANGTICVACNLPNFYNYQKGQCQSCPGSLIFNAITHSCGGGKGTKINNNLIGQHNFLGKVPLYQSLLGVCPSAKRYFNGIQCTACELPKYFNFQTLTCDACPLKYTFDTTTQACQSDSQMYFTNLASPNIYFHGNFSQIIAKIQLKKAQGLKECSLALPFFDSKSNKCISCPLGSPLFDIRRSKCIKCPSGSSYEPQSRICISKQVSMTIERMIMNSR